MNTKLVLCAALILGPLAIMPLASAAKTVGDWACAEVVPGGSSRIPTEIGIACSQQCYAEEHHGGGTACETCDIIMQYCTNHDWYEYCTIVVASPGADPGFGCVVA